MKKTGIKVIVVGLGYGGAVAAVECFLKGHEVVVFEQTKKVSEGGDMIGVTANAAQIIAKWGPDGIADKEMREKICTFSQFSIYDWKGEFLLTQDLPGVAEGTGYMGKRGELLEVLCRHVERLGIEVHRGKRITEYFETDTEAGVVYDGQRYTADAVLACDGVNSMARRFVLGAEAGKPHPSGYATFRAWFDAPQLKDDPEAQWLVEGTVDRSIVFIGPDVHCIFGTGNNCREVSWVLTHVDTADIQESWTLPGKVEDALREVKDWDPRVTAIIKHTPPNQLIDHKLLWRDPLPRWVSDKGRILLVGDSAHTFLPTSIQGAGMAIEDAATAAICLEIAGKNRVPLAFRTSEKMRYERVRIAQRNGIETRSIWHKTDWKKFRDDKSYVQLPAPAWLFNHDAQTYAYEEFETAARAVETGAPYTPRNVPPPDSNARSNDWKAPEVKPVPIELSA